MSLDIEKQNCVQVLQIGSRHRYAIPRILEKASLLNGLFTDSTAWSPLGRSLRMTGLGSRYPRLARLSGRIPSGIPQGKITCTDLPVIVDLLTRKKNPDPLYLLERQLKISKIASNIAIRKTGNPPRITYTLSREFQDYVIWAKSKGAKNILDIFINPRTAWIMNEHAPADSPPFKEDYLKRERESYFTSISNADIVLCPSSFVSEGVAEMFPEFQDRIRIVPYGSSIASQPSSNVPVEGRFIFVGRDLIRKGADVTMRALQIVRRKYPQAEVCFAGVTGSELKASGIEGEGIIGLGNLDVNKLNDEYSRSDAFLLPSKSEGFASVITEACSFGLPLILSKECGAPVTSGKEALIVSSRDEVELTRAMLAILDDRELRKELSNKSRGLAAIFTEDAWGRRLELVVNELLETC